MKLLISFTFVSLMHIWQMNLYSQNITMYLVPGMGTDDRIMQSLDFGESVNEVCIKWPDNPTEYKGLKGLAEKISEQIDTTEKFILLGVSMGGMISQELAQLVNPEAVILVSSIEFDKELPFTYKLSRVIPIHKLLTEKRLAKIADNSKTWKEVEDPELIKLYPKMLKECGAKFLKWQISSIVNWDFKENQLNCPVYHIHGDKDNILPLRKTRADAVVKGATHKLIANGRKEIVLEVVKFLSSEKFKSQ